MREIAGAVALVLRVAWFFLAATPRLRVRAAFLPTRGNLRFFCAFPVAAFPEADFDAAMFLPLAEGENYSLGTAG